MKDREVAVRRLYSRDQARSSTGRSNLAAISVDPFRCRVWSLHDRLDEHVTEESCRLEIASFLEHGQLVPALGRRLLKDPDYDVELIYGARRLFVARHLNRPLLVEVRSLSDRDAIVAMDLENRQRKDISPYERGLSYCKWLRSGHFQSQDEIAASLGVSASQISRLLKLAKLPSVIVAAFASATDICETWGMHLAEILEDPKKRSATIQCARTLATRTPQLSARDVYRELVASSVSGRKLRRSAHDSVVRGHDGRPLFRVRQQLHAVSLIMPLDRISDGMLLEIQQAVTHIVQNGKEEQRVDRPARMLGPQTHDGAVTLAPACSE